MKRIWRVCLAIIFIFPLLFLSLSYFVLYTHTGTNLAFQTAAFFLKSNMGFSAVEGRLLDHFRFNNFYYKTSEFQIQASAIEINWDLLQLLHKKLAVQKIFSDHLKISLTPSSQPSSQKSESLKFPNLKAIQINTLSLAQFSLDSQGEEKFAGENILGQLNFQEKNKNIFALFQMQTNLPIKGKLHLKLQGKINNYDWQIQEEDPFSKWGANGSGTENSVTIKNSQGRLLGGWLFMHGGINWKENFQGKIDLHAKNLQLNLLNPSYPSDLNFLLQAELDNALKLNLQDIHGKIDKETFSGNVHISTLLNEKGIRENHLQMQIQSHARYGKYSADAKGEVLLSRLNQPKNDFKVQGVLEVNSNAIPIPTLGIQLQKPNLKIHFQDKLLTYTGSAYSGGGLVNLEGNVNLQDSPKVHMKIKGQNFLAYHQPEMQIYISPDLTVHNEDENWVVQGKVLIPKADIRFQDTREILTMPKETVILPRQGDKNPKKAPDFLLNVIFTLGEKVHIFYNGLNSNLKGSVGIQYTPKTPIFIANGRIFLKEGSYTLKGKTLNIDNGDFIYTQSDVKNPMINMRMSKVISSAPEVNNSPTDQKLTVGIDVKGSGQNPQITFFSDPPGWSQIDILSLILFDQPATTANSSQVALMANATQILLSGSGGTGQFTSQLKDALGLSQLTLTTANPSNPGQNATSLVLGKYLTPKLFISYSAGIINAVNTIRIRYFFNKRWSIQTQTNSEETAADLLFSP